MSFNQGDVVTDNATDEVFCVFSIEDDALTLTRFGNSQTTTRTTDQVRLLSGTLEVRADPCAREIKKLKKEIKQLNKTLDLMISLYKKVAPEPPKPNPWDTPFVWPHPSYKPPSYLDYQVWCDSGFNNAFVDWQQKENETDEPGE